MTHYALKKLSIKCICFMSAKVGQSKSTGGKASTYYVGQYFVVALLFLLSVV